MHAECPHGLETFLQGLRLLMVWACTRATHRASASAVGLQRQSTTRQPPLKRQTQGVSTLAKLHSRQCYAWRGDVTNAVQTSLHWCSLNVTNRFITGDVREPQIALEWVPRQDESDYDAADPHAEQPPPKPKLRKRWSNVKPEADGASTFQKATASQGGKPDNRK